MTLVVFVGMMLLGISLQKEQVDKATEHCDEIYGINNYEWVEATTFARCGLTRCWVCVGDKEK